MAEDRPKSGERWEVGNGNYTVRVLAVAEGYAMVRSGQAVPFVLAVQDLEKKVDDER